MADGELPALSVDDAARILLQMRAVVGDRSVVLVGGQAIALWGEQLKEYLPGDEEPVTSRDIDFQGSSSAVVAAAELLGGTAEVATFDDHGPHAGVTVFSDHEGHTRVIDFLTAPYGLDFQAADWAKGDDGERCPWVTRFRVLKAVDVSVAPTLAELGIATTSMQQRARLLTDPDIHERLVQALDAAS